jgi:hypothetical protein
MSNRRFGSILAVVLSLSIPAASFAANLNAKGGVALPAGLNIPVSGPSAALPGAGFTIAGQTPVLPSSTLPTAALAASAANGAPKASASAAQPSAPQARAASAQQASSAQARPASAVGQAGQAAAPSDGNAARSAGSEQEAAKASAVFDDASVAGKTLLLVGTRSSRPFILEETVRVARELKLKLLLLDKGESRKNSKSDIADADFIPAPIDKRDESTMKTIVDQVVAFARGVKIDVVAAFRSHHAQLTGRIVNALRVVGVPKKAVVTADNKQLTRDALNTVPELAVPSRKINSAAAARKAYVELGGGKFVMKSVHGENSRFVEMGIDSADAAEAAYRKMDKALKDYAKQSESSDTIFNKYPGILMERMLEMAPGTVEASVEMVVRNGEVVFAMVSDTHGIGKKGELAGGSMTFPSTQPQDVQDALIKASALALKTIGIENGNARTDVFMTPDGARIIEINPYLGGAAIWKAVKLVSGVSLVEYGIRALLNLATPPQPDAKEIVDYRFAAAPATGVIESIEGVDAASLMPGIKHLQVLAGVGDHITEPIGNGFEEWLEIMGTGKDLAEARRNAVAALAAIKVKVRKADGTLVEATGAYLQPQN